ncbi:hypothetical protein GCM10027566_06330 [Arachidicoccus ginsenosidivorans]|uniref:NfeD family protein n=1 Tax=Arachidicoccus ginsenosidivorans TaxID=496057 RepID=UPI001CEF8464|nr:hypothetical protein [Arachidicoccus ginsenosidivorans]
MDNLIGLNGQVYIPIPANMNGKGRIQISVLGATHEIDAMTRGANRLTSGTNVKVLQIENAILIVEKVI